MKISVSCPKWYINYVPLLSDTLARVAFVYMRKHSGLPTHTRARWNITGLSHGEQKPAARINATPSHLCLQPVATSSSLCLEFIPEGRVVTVSSSLFSRTPLYKHIRTAPHMLSTLWVSSLTWPVLPVFGRTRPFSPRLLFNLGRATQT